jgi:hypothetical protein
VASRYDQTKTSHSLQAQARNDASTIRVVGSDTFSVQDYAQAVYQSYHIPPPVQKIRVVAEKTTFLSCRSGQSSFNSLDYKITARAQPRALALCAL